MKLISTKIKNIVLTFIIIGVFSPSISSASFHETSSGDLLTEILIAVFASATIQTSIPQGSCLPSIRLTGGSGNGRVNYSLRDDRGIEPNSLITYSSALSGRIVRCGTAERCEFIGNGSTTVRINDLVYNGQVEWGDCRAESSGGEPGEENGIISNLRHGLDVLRGIFPGKLSSERGVINTIGAIIRWTLGIAGAIFVLMIVYGGFQYLIVGSNEKNVDKAKTTITYAVIGMVIIAGAWLIADFVISVLLRGA